MLILKEKAVCAVIIIQYNQKLIQHYLTVFAFLWIII